MILDGGVGTPVSPCLQEEQWCGGLLSLANFVKQKIHKKKIIVLSSNILKSLQYSVGRYVS
jgi:hypothetical protein